MAEVEVELIRIVINDTSAEQVIILREKGGKRAFPIVIGIWEAAAIHRHVMDQKTPRPMTHNLLAGVLEGLGVTLEKIVVHDVRQNTFFAKIVIKRDGNLIEVDSRPSDAVALATLLKAPMFVEERVFGKIIPPQILKFMEEEEDEEEEGKEED
jgi:hypothetical protein